ncbi:MAG TPA: hypothetical protein DCW90_16110 [Lachnospiraceae bacterium]|nr:hypothetical protein [Lachnospiraceae bacterium]
MEKIILLIVSIPYSSLVWILLNAISNRTQQVVVGCLLLAPIIIALVVLFKEDKSNKKQKKEPIMKQVPSKKKGPCVEEYWTLIEFRKKFDRMKVGNCTNHTTGEVFKCCMFFKDADITFVNFYNDIGVLSKEEILRRKDKLKIGKNAVGKYYLYEGKETFPQPIDLGIKY